MRTLKSVLYGHATLLIIALLSLLGSLAIILSTRWGPWAYSDSAEYIVSARTFLEGDGLGYYAPSRTFKPLTLHPPLYPLLLSLFGLFGADLLAAARWLNVILFAATLFTTGWFSYRLLRSAWLAVTISLIMLTMTNLVDVFSGAMSEPLFTLNAALSICLLAVYLVEGGKHRLVLSAIAASLAFLSRYPGVAIIAAGLTGILFLDRLPWKQRLRNLLLYSSVSLIPTILWLVWIYLHTQTISSRHFNFGINIWQALIPFRLDLTEIFWSWLPFPTHLPTYSYYLTLAVLLAAGTLLLFGFAFTGLKMKRAGRLKWPLSAEFSFVFLWVVAALAYLALLASSFIFSTPVPDLIPRTLLPVQFFLPFILLGSALFFIRELHLPRWSTLVPVILALPFIASNILGSWSLVSHYYQQGAGYTAKSWHYSNTLEAVAALPAELPIISNEAAALLLLTDRVAYDFCTLPCDQPGNVRYGDNPNDEVQRIFREKGAALVLFYPFCTPRENTWFAERMEQVENLTRDLSVDDISCDGAIYFYP